jgi:hypothetical protein
LILQVTLFLKSFSFSFLLLFEVDPQLLSL